MFVIIFPMKRFLFMTVRKTLLHKKTDYSQLNNLRPDMLIV